MKDSATSQFSMEKFLYLLAFLAALGIRFFSLGQAPLGDAEASLALQALNLQAPLQAQPAYLALTSAWFFFFGSDNGLTRFWPALAGSLLVLAPYLFRQRLGKAASLALAFLLVIEPSLVASSRQADGRMLALTALAFLIGFVMARKSAAAGIAAGLVLLGGPSVWQGLLSIGIAWFIARALQPAADDGDVSLRMGVFEQPESINAVGLNVKIVIGWALGAFLVVGTLFLTQVQLLGAFAGSLARFIEGAIGKQPGQALQLIFIAWFMSNPLGILLGMAEAAHARRQRDRVGTFLAWGWIVALLLVLVNPAHQTVDLIWPALPMLALSARAAARYLNLGREKPAFFAMAGLSLALLFSMGLSVVGAASAMNENELSMRLASLLATVFLLLAVSFLVVWGWGMQVAGRGLRVGVMVILIIYVIATGWKSAGLGPLPETEIWNRDAYPKGSSLLVNTLKDFSKWETGRSDVLEVTVAGIQNSALFWQLRQFRTVNRAAGVSANTSPALLITPRLNELGGNAPYSGQVFGWSVKPDWDKMNSSQWLKWLFFREAPLVVQDVQLWVRTDLFPGGSTTK